MDILFQEVSYSYSAGTPFEKKALKNVNIHIPSGSYTALIGHTGSGKSTLLLHLNGLLRPTTGQVQVGDTVIQSKTKGKVLREVRREVGVVFQFPEHQLFEETVEKDIMFGPMNFGVSEDEARRRAHELVELLGLPKEVLYSSPFDLSGGQMRRVAIAGVLAFEPSILVLDEPTAGLDPQGQEEIMALFHRLHEEKGLTTVLVTHSMEDAARFADHLVIMHEGTAVQTGTPQEIFSDSELLKNYRLEVPQTVKFQRTLEEKIGRSLGDVALTEKQLAKKIARAVGDAHA